MTLLALVGVVLAFNLMTFGNGPVMIPLLQHELVDTRRVLTLDQLLYAFAIARATPGPANMYVAAIGYFLDGLPGAILTMLALILPGYLMVPFVRVYDRLRDRESVGAFVGGLTAASVGVIFAAIVGMARSSLTEVASWIVFGLALGLLAVPRVPALAAVALAALAGLGLRSLGA
jgi:chromate transporter